MKVLFLSYSVVGQSNDLRAAALARALAREGHALTLLSAAARPNRSLHNETSSVGSGTLRRLCVRSLGPSRFRNSGLSLGETLRRRSTIAGEPFDLIHGFGHRPTVSWVGPTIARRHRIPYVADWSDLFGDGGIAAERSLPARLTLGIFDRWLEPRVYRQADAVSVISRGLEGRLRQLDPSLPVTLVPPGGFAESERDSVQGIRGDLGIPTEAPVVVHVSQNHQDVGLLQSTLAHICERRRDIRFLLVGPDIRSLLRGAELHEVASRTHFAGRVPHQRIPEFLAAADVALLPYPPSIKNECRFPCSFSEYAAAGLPVVTQPTGDIGRLAEGDSGALLVPASGQAMAAAVDRILGDRDLATSLGRRGRELAGRELSWSVGAARLLDLYSQLTREWAMSRVLATT